MPAGGQVDSALVGLIFGIILVVVGGILAVAGIPDAARRRRVARTAITPIARSPQTGTVAAAGVVVPGEEGLVTAPFSGENVVWVRVTVDEWVTSRRTGREWRRVARESDGRPFIIDDGSGETARVLPRNAVVIVPAHQIGSHEDVREALPRLEAFMHGHGQTTRGWFGTERTLRYREEVLRPGDRIHVLGPARSAGNSSRDGAAAAVLTSRLLFADGGSRARELLVTHETPERLLTKLLWKLVVGMALLVLGLALGVAGIAKGALDGFDTDEPVGAVDHAILSVSRSRPSPSPARTVSSLSRRHA